MLKTEMLLNHLPYNIVHNIQLAIFSSGDTVTHFLIHTQRSMSGECACAPELLCFDDYVDCTNPVYSDLQSAKGSDGDCAWTGHPLKRGPQLPRNRIVGVELIVDRPYSQMA